MVPLVLALLLILIFLGAGFVMKLLWIVAIALLASLLLGFLFRSHGRRGTRGRRDHW
ncbi:hydrophobic protein [Streptomyces sp. YGL11-2]|uniref:hydrophobic protein n=1 Tax=Streptomyces sp. YGL11-2 TaxID=3414028 RepID=UPI003CF44527